MIFYIDDKGQYFDRVHQFGYTRIPEKWINEWASEGIQIIILKKTQ